jgi:hypothetical protein
MTPSLQTAPADSSLDREASYQTYLGAPLSGDREQCRACFEHWLATTPDLRIVYQDLVQRALYAVGERWERGKVSVASEHLATAIRSAFPDLPILVGGQAFRWGGRERVETIAGVRFLASLADLEAWLDARDAHAH